MPRASTGSPFGSSPRMRGTRDRNDRRGRANRIIPAHAGNSPGVTPASLPNWIIPAHAGNSLMADLQVEAVLDHPRACGELFGVGARYRCRLGSSPRMRGTQLQIEIELSLLRIIPRACGELSGSGSGVADAGGSSPRMRGTPNPGQS